MTQVKQIQSKYIFKNIELPVLPGLSTPEDYRNHYIGIYPDMLNTSVTKTVDEKQGTQTFEFKPKVGTHG